MPKIPTTKPIAASKRMILPTKGEQLAEHLTSIAMLRGLYYTALYDKLGENLKLFGVSMDEEFTDVLWARTAIQGHTIKLQINKAELLNLIDGNGQTLAIPKELKL
jgi:hypothetical protein